LSEPLTLDDFDFDLPDALIALRPAEPRDHARLLQVIGDQLEDRRVADLPRLLRPGDVLVFNDTRVIPARLFGTRLRGDNSVSVEAILLERQAGDIWTAMLKPGKRVRPGDQLSFGNRRDGEARGPRLQAEAVARTDDGVFTLRFDRSEQALDDAIRAAGVMPLPPYIAQRRAEDDRDAEDYQTVYARREGSVAAPTAGLHFTDRLLDELDRHGILRTFVTLHVGAGTFLPVKTDRIEDHRMHSEWGEVSEETADLLNRVHAAGGRVVAVGTTSCRLLETAVDEVGSIRPFRGPTDIFLRPGRRLRAIDGLMTNFHLPRSTLLMLVSAFAGQQRMRRAYQHAVTDGYRFYSYGDTGLWWPEHPPAESAAR
jgi:S-adenosylmethionine:tRNA ribosyltransferase-isomerase